MLVSMNYIMDVIRIWEWTRKKSSWAPEPIFHAQIMSSEVRAEHIASYKRKVLYAHENNEHIRWTFWADENIDIGRSKRVGSEPPPHWNWPRMIGNSSTFTWSSCAEPVLGRRFLRLATATAKRGASPLRMSSGVLKTPYKVMQRQAPRGCLLYHLT